MPSNSSKVGWSEKLVGALIVLTFVASLIWLFSILPNRNYALTVAGQAYAKHNLCVRDGFAGKHAYPIYRCVTGVWLTKEINKMGKMAVVNETIERDFSDQD